MTMRSLKIFRVLFLCIFVGSGLILINSCSKESSSDDLAQELFQQQMPNPTEEPDVLIAKDYNMNIDEEVVNEDVSVAINEVIEQLKAYPAGQIIDTANFSHEVLDSLFYIEELNQEIIDRITGKSYKENSDITYSDLRYIRVIHTGYDKKDHIGEMIVNKAIAEDMIEIFKELYSISYPIEKILLIDTYDADDIKSMEDNNSSAFNYRFIEGTTRRSVHSDGLAVDINPLYNPYVRTRGGKIEVLPESAAEYVDRMGDNIYYIRKDDPCYTAFVSRGFTWGGEWENSKDYQHFEKKIKD